MFMGPVTSKEEIAKCTEAFAVALTRGLQWKENYKGTMDSEKLAMAIEDLEKALDDVYTVLDKYQG